MLIPLDYYRILGVPPEATDEQLLQAWQDRRLQLPRWEYSEAAIQSRLHLLEQAYQFLGNSLKRDRYQQAFFQDPNPSTEPNLGDLEQSQLTENLSQEEPVLSEEWAETRSPNSLPELDIPPEQWGGALLLLQELGEYEEIIKQAEVMIQSGSTESQSIELQSAESESGVSEPAAATLPHQESLTSQPIADIYLTLALAYLELSREQWQNNQYEQAAQSELKGLAWLEQQNLLPGVQAEIRSELNKLRPYRILELLSSESGQASDRQQGLELLAAMLQQRQGIDGTGDDGSGLDADNFLRFIQQIRTYLTVEEQRTLFEAETHRPSAAASYLAAYALIAQGFSQKKPEQIFQAWQLFNTLQSRQDICLEKSICALLLGQTEVAIASLQQHQDPKPLGLVQDYSEGDPDWLRGLCLYGEQWLQSEVFAKFWDLATQKPSLKEYFANESVQTYLEQNPLSLDIPTSPSLLPPGQTMAIPQAASPPPYSTLKQRRGSKRRQQSRAAQMLTPKAESNTATLNAPSPSLRPSPEVANGNGYWGGRDGAEVESAVPLSAPGRSQNRQSPADAQVRPYSRATAKSRRKRSLKLGRVVLLAAILGGCVGATAIAVKALLDHQSPLSQLQSEQLFVPLNQPVVEIPPANALLSAPESITPEFAEQVVQTWLASKSEAFGNQYQTERMATVLGEPLLSVWKNRVTNLQQSKGYWQYQHGLEAKSLQIKSISPTQATIDAIVREKATYFQDGKEKTNRSYDDTLRVRYGLVRQGDRWLIASIQVIN